MSDESDDIVLEEEGESLQDTLKKLRERLKKTIAEKQEYLEGWQRARADFANEKRASELLRVNIQEDVQADTAEKIIPLIDAFDMAISSSNFSSMDESWRKGVESLRGEALKVLKSLGCESFSPLGEEFDPTEMSAVREVKGEPHKVIAVDRVGYKMSDRIIRPAYVSIGNK